MIVSSLYLWRTTAKPIADLQSSLVSAQTEASTGRFADIGTALGAKTSLSIDLRNVFNRTTVEIEQNGLAASELDVVQNGLTNLVDVAHSFVSTIVGSRNALNGQAQVKDTAKHALAQMQNILNSTQNGKALFGGINSDAAPLADYLSTPSSPAMAAVDAAFLTQFGITQTDPGVANITAAQMDSFLNGPFADLFNSTNWSANWSTASSQNSKARVDDNLKVDIATNANDSAFRNMAMAFTMVFELGAGSLNQAAFEKLVDRAATIASIAATATTNIAGKLGNVQKLLVDQKTRLNQRNDTITQQLQRLEGVDQAEVATRINMLMTQLETSYSLTARINKLSLLNYL